MTPPHADVVVVVVVVEEMNIIKVALSHFCCRTTVQSDSVSVARQVTVRRWYTARDILLDVVEAWGGEGRAFSRSALLISHYYLAPSTFPFVLGVKDEGHMAKSVTFNIIHHEVRHQIAIY